MRKENILWLFLLGAIIFTSGYRLPSNFEKRPLDVWAFRSVLDLQPRMLTVALDSECYIAYDLTQCKLYKAWKGGVSLEGAAYNDQKDIQPSSWGTPYFLDTLHNQKWQVNMKGKSVFSNAIYEGYTLKNNKIFIKYALILTTNDTLKVEECPEVFHNQSKIAFERKFTTSKIPLETQVILTLPDTSFLLKPNGTSALTVNYNFLPEQSPPISKLLNIHEGKVLMNKNDCFTCHQLDTDEVGPSFQRIAQKYKNTKESKQDLAIKIKKGSTGIWGNGRMNPHPSLTENELNQMIDFVFTLKPKETTINKSLNQNTNIKSSVPNSPGFGAPLEGVHPSFDLISLHNSTFKPRVGGLAFLPDGRLLVTTWDKIGGVYIIDGLSSNDSSKLKVKRIASGLAEPLGIEVVNGEIYVLQKQELTKLIDLDGDEIIDEYQVICNSWSVSADFHEFAFGLVYKDGYFYATLSMAMRLKPGEKQLPDRGKTIKISKNGSFEVVNFGLRTPNGIGLGLENEIFITDNQGQWLPANKLIHVKKGEYHGMFWGWLSNAPAPEMAMPAIWLPEHEIGNSPSEPVLIHQGTYKGQMLHGDVTFGGINRDYLEKINGQYQGAVFRFSQGFEAGVNRLRWGPDGNLYIGEVGMMGGGWSWNNRLSGLQCMKFNNKPTFEMLSVKAKRDGFEIEFTQPLKANLTLKETDLNIQQWWYLPTKNYGGPKMDLVNLSPTQITISKDRKKVYVKLSNLKPKHVIYFSLSNQIKNQKNQSLWSGEAWYTLNAIPKEI